jgi:import inner membrane translocase subunit TIM8
VTGSISTRFSSGEAYCLQNCVDRFLDTSLFIVKKLEEQRRNMQG